LNTVKETYNKDPSLYIYLKIISFNCIACNVAKNTRKTAMGLPSQCPPKVIAYYYHNKDKKYNNI